MTRPQSRSFRNRLLCSFLIASLVPMIICSALLSQIFRIQMKKQMETDAQTQTAHLMTALDHVSDALPGAARALEESGLLPRAFTSLEDTKVNTALFYATEGSRDLADYSLYNLGGSLCYSTGSVTPGATLPTRWGILFAAKNAGGQAVYQPPMDGGEALLQGAALLSSPQGEPLGYLVMELSGENFQKLFSGKYGSSNQILLLSRYWHPVYASQSGLTEELADTLRSQLLGDGRPGAQTEAVPNMEAARGFAEICKESVLPLVADIHFDYKLAIAAAEAGASKIRINPGNIGGEDRVKAVVEVCKDRHIPIRIGVNGGSLEKELLEKYGHPTAEALVESAFGHLELLEKYGFYDTCVSMKSSHVPTMVAAARLFRGKCDYPLHIGVTETGPVRQGLIKSAMGIGSLLLDGIGDTLRVSLTDDPVEEVYAAKDILKAAGLRKDGVDIISCPTCGRTRIDLIGLVNRVDAALKDCKKPITVAVMGCVVNGPGEAREADIGIAGGDGWGMIFEKGEQVDKLPYDQLLPELLRRIENMDV